MMLHCERVPQPGAIGGAPELVQARAGGAAGELGILGEGDGPLDPVRGHGAERVLALGLDVAEGDVEPVRRGLGREPVEPRHHALALGPGVAENGRAAADLGVQAAHLGGAAAGDERAQPALKRELDDLAVGEQLEQEGLHLVEVGRPAEVHHHDAGLHLAHAGQYSPSTQGIRPSSSAIFVSPATV